jgi:hypothetical protein
MSVNAKAAPESLPKHSACKHAFPTEQLSAPLAPAAMRLASLERLEDQRDANRAAGSDQLALS